MLAKPRIAYLFSRYPVVSHTFCDSEMLALEAMGFDLEIGSLNRPPNSFRHERLDRLRAGMHYPPPPDVIDALSKDPAFNTKLGSLIKDHDQRYGSKFKPLTRARNAWYFASLFRRLGVQHVHVHFANRTTHTAIFLKKLGFTFSFTVHAQDFILDLGNDELLAEMARESEFVVAVSDFSRGLMVQKCPDSEQKIVRIYNGIEVDDFKPVLVRDRQPLRILSIGRLIEFKGFQHLIGAAALLKKQGVAIDLRIVGDGPMRAKLEAQIASEGLSDTVTLLGVRTQEEVKRELAECDLFALASIFDHAGASDILPTVITEAMSSSLPVVSTKVAGIPEMVVHGETGLLVEEKDDAALASAIAELARDPAKRGRMGQAGRARAEQLFTFPNTAGKLGQMFADKLSQARVEGSARIDTPMVYLCHDWKGEPFTKDCPQFADGVRWIAERTAWPEAGGDRAALATLESLPDASVIESLWLRRTQHRSKLEACRNKLGDAVDSQAFYQSARHAVYFADVLGKSQVRLVHAHRATAVVTAWMLKQLLPSLKVTAGIEEAPGLPRGLLTRLLPDLDLISVSDEPLNELLERKGEDILKLYEPFRRTEMRLGPLKVKMKKASPVVDRRAAEWEWLAKLRALIQ